MDLQISVFLLFILFTAGHSLYCYECMGLTGFCVKKPVMCPFGASNCVSSTMVVEIGNIRSNMKIKGCSLGCKSGSMNLGILKSSYSCCGTSFCNAKDSPEPNTIVRNGKTCYYCDGLSCSNILSCSGSEDRCITATGSVEGQATVVKGCVAKSICDSKTLANRFQDISCCKGNLCNGDESVAESITQSFIQNITQSFMYDDDESVTQSFIQSVTQSFVYNNAENVKYSDAKSVKKSFMYDDAKSVTYNVAQSVSQSFLFFCTSLLFFILLN
ncbi:urokinase plasminogen activator surface receptor [Carassius gibelio]|uniref:urokinase plasminogen activator surface receptor n=1 Tax=Carassius gibelio TaxID=101364 RepID=UPI002278D1BC|nr:urokinase plasminogen activator surface receptor [Carassius gibelio]